MDVVMVCLKGGTLTQSGSTNQLLVSSVGGIVGGVLRMLDQNRNTTEGPSSSAGFLLVGGLMTA